jgi:hypothetical protein
MFRTPRVGVRVVLALFATLLAASPAFATTYNDDAIVGWIYTGTWTAATGVNGAISNTEHWSNTASSAAIFTCSGVNAFTIYYSTASNRGKANLWVTDANGIVGTVETFDMYSASTVRQVYKDWYLSGLVSTGTYTVHIQNTGTKNASSSDYFISVDAVNDC